MSSGGSSYNGGRTRMKTKVFLNIYDLSPANDYLVPVGMGLHHSGIEIMGTEYSFGSGAGIFEGSPKDAAGARFRVQVEMGSFDGGSQELNKALDEMKGNGLFGPSDYNLVRKNCNHFCNALCWRLLRKQIPAHVNRWADLGNCCSCLLPKKLLEDSPVGGGGGGSGNNNNTHSSSSFVVPTTASMNRGTNPTAFAGKGQSLGGSSNSNNNNTSTTGAEKEGLLSKWSRSSHTAQAQDDLTDRREKARKAALARFDRSRQPLSTTKEAQD